MAPVHDPDYQRMLGRLRAARKAANLTQTEVAARLGKPQPYVSKVERGERRIDPVELARFAEIYGQTVEFFLKREDV
jgi:transcriptional regulator with XRE-family HTH domain